MYKYIYWNSLRCKIKIMLAAGCCMSFTRVHYYYLFYLLSYRACYMKHFDFISSITKHDYYDYVNKRNKSDNTHHRP